MSPYRGNLRREPKTRTRDGNPRRDPNPNRVCHPEQANNTVQLSEGMFGEGVASAAATKVATGGGGVVTLNLDDTMDF